MGHFFWGTLYLYFGNLSKLSQLIGGAGKTSQFPQPTCFWKWVGGTNPQKSNISTLEVCFSVKKNSTSKSSMELESVIHDLQILPIWNNFESFIWPLRPFDSLPPVSSTAPPIWSNLLSHFFQLDFSRSCKPHFSSTISGIITVGSHVVSLSVDCQLP